MTDIALTGVRDEDLLASIQPYLDGGFNLVHLERSLTVRRWTAFLSTDPIDQVPVPVTGSFEVTLAIGAEVEVSNFPATQPVSIAGTVPVSDNGGSITVDGSVSVSNFPGTQPVSGTVSVNALPAGTANIGDVDVLTMPVVQVGDNGGSLTVDGTFFQATQPVSIAAVVPVSDNAGSLTVDGSVSLAAAIPAGTNNIGDVDVLTVPANMSVNNAQVSGTVVDVNSGNKSAGTQRIVLATDQPQLTNALKVDGSAVTQPVSGTVSVNALPTGTNNIGDVDVASIAAGTNAIGKVSQTAPAAADILGASTVATAQTTLVTVPAGRIWKGTIACSQVQTAVDVGAANVTVSVSGTNSVPATGTILCRTSQDLATGVGATGVTASVSDIYVSAPVGNSVVITSLMTGTTVAGHAMANGILL